MSLIKKIRSLLGQEPEQLIVPQAPTPRPTSLAERKQKGINVSRDPSLADTEATRAMRDSSANSDNPYETAAWEVDVTSGRRRLKRINATHTAKKAPNNPYDTSSNLDPWKLKD